jgi:predicted PurR-regulated permease PerM
LALSVYWSIDHLHFERLWLSLVPAGRRDQARQMWRSVEVSVGGYLRNEIAQLLLAILLLVPGYLLLGIPYPTLLALAGAVAWLIPVAGVIFALIPALLVALGANPVIGLGTALYTLAVFLGLQLLVQPRLLHYRSNHSYLLVVLLMIPLADSYGFFGLLAAPPLAVGIEHLLIVIYEQRRRPPEADLPEVAALEKRLQELRVRADEADGEVTPQVESLMERLSTLLDRAQEIVDGAVSAEAPASQPRR